MQKLALSLLLAVQGTIVFASGRKSYSEALRTGINPTSFGAVIAATASPAVREAENSKYGDDSVFVHAYQALSSQARAAHDTFEFAQDFHFERGRKKSHSRERQTLAALQVTTFDAAKPVNKRTHSKAELPHPELLGHHVPGQDPAKVRAHRHHSAPKRDVHLPTRSDATQRTGTLDRSASMNVRQLLGIVALVTP